jgi:hypothetical protein
MEKVGIFFGHLEYTYLGHLEYISAIWYFVWPFGIVLPVLVYCVKNNLATLHICTIVMEGGGGKFNYPQIFVLSH